MATPPGGIAFAGAPFYFALMAAAREEVPGAPVCFVLDCCADGAEAVMAIRGGWRDLALDPALPGRDRVVDIARRAGAVLHADLATALNLADAADPEVACRDLLSRVIGGALNGDEACGT